MLSGVLWRHARHVAKLDEVCPCQYCFHGPASHLEAVVLDLGGQDGTTLLVQFGSPLDGASSLDRTQVHLPHIHLLHTMSY